MLGDTKWLAQGHMAKSEFYLGPPIEGRPAYGSSPPTPFRIPKMAGTACRLTMPLPAQSHLTEPRLALCCHSQSNLGGSGHGSLTITWDLFLSFG